MINQKVTNTYGWTLHRYTFDQLFEWLSVPHRSNETTAQFDAMTKTQRDNLKQQAQAFVMGTLDGNQRKAEFILSRSAITLDYDHNTDAQAVYALWRKVSWRAILYTSRQHRPGKPRVRILIPTSRDMTLNEFDFISHKVAEIIKTDGTGIDDTCHQPSRAMFAGSVSADQEYKIRRNLEPLFLDPDEFLKDYPGWQQTEWDKPEPIQTASTTDSTEWPYKWMQEEYVDGTRTDALTGALGVLFAHGIPSKLAWQFIQGFNLLFDPPLEQEKIIHTYNSFAGREGTKS